MANPTGTGSGRGGSRGRPLNMGSAATPTPQPAGAPSTPPGPGNPQPPGNGGNSNWWTELRDWSLTNPPLFFGACVLMAVLMLICAGFPTLLGVVLIVALIALAVVGLGIAFMGKGAKDAAKGAAKSAARAGKSDSGLNYPTDKFITRATERTGLLKAAADKTQVFVDTTKISSSASDTTGWYPGGRWGWRNFAFGVPQICEHEADIDHSWVEWEFEEVVNPGGEDHKAKLRCRARPLGADQRPLPASTCQALLTSRDGTWDALMRNACKNAAQSAVAVRQPDELQPENFRDRQIGGHIVEGLNTVATRTFTADLANMGLEGSVEFVAIVDSTLAKAAETQRMVNVGVDPTVAFLGDVAARIFGKGGGGNSGSNNT
ncbi:MAG: hypothetical protein KKI02_10100 [Planctomycetes bacterium]|nr:hypothetical protein [Planctomycetota bacterium]